jgi:hypothetical protein
MILNLNFKPKDLNGNILEAWDVCGEFIASALISMPDKNPTKIVELAKKCKSKEEFEVSLEDITFLREFNKNQTSYYVLVQAEIDNAILMAINKE